MEELVEQKEDVKYLEDLSRDEENFINDDRLNINLYDRIDFLIGLKKVVTDDNADNYPIAFKKGYSLAFSIDRDEFLEFKEVAIGHIDLPYNEYSDMIGEMSRVKIKKR